MRVSSGVAYIHRMWQFGCDEAQLAAAWREARPFRHVIVDDLLPEAQLPALMEMLEEEPVAPYEADIFAFEASAPAPVSDELKGLRTEFADVLAPPLSRITGRAVRTVDMRAFAYRVGHYLLPHSDHQDGLGRALAYIYYLPTPEPPAGGELELFACGEQEGELTDIASAALIRPVANRLVVFEVGTTSLHQVREVMAGLRISLAGWFYP